MLDVIILADEVSHLLKTTYARVAKELTPFNLAFTDVMNKHGVMGMARGRLKSEIGRILAKRPRTAKMIENNRKIPTAPPTKANEFSVVEKTCNRVILTCLETGYEITYVRDKERAVICSSFAGTLSAREIARGALLAGSYFVGMDSAAIRQAPITLDERSDDVATLTIAGKWKMVACRGAKGSVVAQVSDIRSGKPVKQKDLPATILQEARAIVTRYFRDTRTADFFKK